ncbi:uncharacterized protein UV8b_07615 [Ustilaginoidea virens]|uniref:Peptidase A1 domain-containing protein n=1 Tax=Ustilaginoidea virens TaxID=1159556 RepID=A0A063BNI0_USTVR|nr:uncharacterized protein UV8b_07615 [Ustilaginoidea virens]QUC23374.1 hypothetical protein UV8b_07615 [Ustilaginoidea virens]GAO19787.1 hypothetical protein UVI_02045780 [Ustilaginoidea virens]
MAGSQSLLLLALAAGGVHAAAAAAAAAAAPAPVIPISYSYGGYPRIQADLSWGTPSQSSIPTIFDTGSPSFWVYGPHAIINYGSKYHYQLGPCNKSVETFFDWPKSTTYSSVTNFPRGLGYSYGGNGKIVAAYTELNDTFSFANANFPPLANNQVAISNFTLVTEADDTCSIPASSFDHSILGLAPLTGIQAGPSFRANLRTAGKTSSSSFSVWMDQAPRSSNSKYTYRGAAVFGAIPSTPKYVGPLVRIKQTNPDPPYTGYYAALPKLTASNLMGPGGKPREIGLADPTVKNCLLDSGTGADRIPFNESQIAQATGLLRLHNPSILAWNGTCDSIPHSASLKFTFDGATPGTSVTIAVPIRSYARGIYDSDPGLDTSKYCGLTLSGDEYGDCVLGASFFSAIFAVFHDDMQQVALAQGGVSRNTADGLSAIGPLTQIAAGKDIPFSV